MPSRSHGPRGNAVRTAPRRSGSCAAGPTTQSVGAGIPAGTVGTRPTDSRDLLQAHLKWRLARRVPILEYRKSCSGVPTRRPFAARRLIRRRCFRRPLNLDDEAAHRTRESLAIAEALQSRQDGGLSTRISPSSIASPRPAFGNEIRPEDDGSAARCGHPAVQSRDRDAEAFSRFPGRHPVAQEFERRFPFPRHRLSPASSVDSGRRARLVNTSHGKDRCFFLRCNRKPRMAKCRTLTAEPGARRLEEAGLRSGRRLRGRSLTSDCRHSCVRRTNRETHIQAAGWGRKLRVFGLGP